MRRVAIVGVGVTPRNNEYLKDSDRKSWRNYIVEAAYSAFADVEKGFDPRDIQYIVAGYHGEATVEAGGAGPVISDILGLHPVGVTLLSANCSSAGVCTNEAVGMVGSGLYDRVLVIGFDKHSDLYSRADKRAICTDVDFDYNFGYDHLHEHAILAQLDFQRYGAKTVLGVQATYRTQMYWYGNRNPNSALYGVPCPVTKEELMDIWELSPGSGKVNPEFWRKLPPLPNVTDGASAFIVVPAEHASQYTDSPVYIDGVSYKCGSHLISNNMYYPVPELAQYNAVDFAATRAAVEEAYKMAKVEPKDIDFAQVYENPFGPLVTMIEATGVPPKGQAAQFIIDGQTAVDGRLPTGTDGGRFGFGAPSGPDVSDAVYEAVIQMREKAGDRQIPKADVCLISCMQGPMASSPAMVLRRY